MCFLFWCAENPPSADNALKDGAHPDVRLDLFTVLECGDAQPRPLDAFVVAAAGGLVVLRKGKGRPGQDNQGR